MQHLCAFIPCFNIVTHICIIILLKKLEGHVELNFDIVDLVLHYLKALIINHISLEFYIWFLSSW